VTTRLLVRLCALVVSVAIFAAVWATVGARPWQADAKALGDPRLLALEQREATLKREAAQVQLEVKERWATYRHRLKQRKKAIAVAERRHRRELLRARLAAQAAAAQAAASQATTIVAVSAPSVSVVSLPPVTKSTSS
jgi:hypothetical protein